MTDAPGRELVRRADPLLDKEGHNNIARMANTLGKASVFPDVKGAADAYAKILLGRSIGLGPMQAMTGIHIVEGKPQISATTLAAFVRESPRYDYRVLYHSEERCLIEFGEGQAPGRKATADRVTPPPVEEQVALEQWVEERWKRWAKSLGYSFFTITEAQTAGLGKWPEKAKWDKSQWGKWPRNMLFARAMSNGVKWYCPDLFGGVPVYTEGDEFTERLSLTAGTGNGEPEGIALPPTVEAVIARAQEVGHAALSNRAAIEVSIGGVDDEEIVREWVERAHAELNDAGTAPAREADIEIDDVVDVDVLPAEDDAQGWRERSQAKLAEWLALGGDDVPAEAGPEIAEEAALLKVEADTALQIATSIDEGGGIDVGEINKTEGSE